MHSDLNHRCMIWHAFIQVAVNNTHDLEQYVQPALQFAARAWCTQEDQLRHAWQQACVLSQLRCTHAAAALCQIASSDSHELDPELPRIEFDAERGQHIPSAAILGFDHQWSSVANASVSDNCSNEKQVVLWQPDSGAYTGAPMDGCMRNEKGLAALTDCTSRTPLNSISQSEGILAFDQMGGTFGERASFVDAWLTQNRNLISSLQTSA